MAFNYDKYLRLKFLPHLWCPGCGIGVVLKSVLRGIDTLEWQHDDIAFVSGIGCTSRAPGYLDFNTLHTTHGRALSFATGVKMARPEKHVIVMAGDGDMLAIGGNHFIHACRRNIDITIILNNNNIYGMTGGQHSPTTPFGDFASTTPYGNIDPNFDPVQLAIGAGATFVARGTVANGIQLDKYIKAGLEHKGVSVIEIISNCHTQYGRRNKLSDPVSLVESIKKSAVPIAKWEQLSDEEKVGKFPIGEFRNVEAPEFTQNYIDLTTKVRDTRAKARIQEKLK